MNCSSDEAVVHVEETRTRLFKVKTFHSVCLFLKTAKFNATRNEHTDKGLFALRHVCGMPVRFCIESQPQREGVVHVQETRKRLLQVKTILCVCLFLKTAKFNANRNEHTDKGLFALSKLTAFVYF